MLKKFSFVLTRDGIKKLIFISFGSLILSFCEVFGIGIVIPIMALFLDPQKIKSYTALRSIYKFIGPKDDIQFLSILIVIAIVFFVLKSIYSIFITYCQQSFIRKTYNRLADEVLESYLNRPYSFHLENNSAILFKNVYTEVGHFIAGFLTPFVLINSEVLVLLGIFSLLFFLYPKVTFSLIIVAVIILIGINFSLKKKIGLYSLVREKSSEQIYKSALEALHAIKEIKVYRAQQFFLHNFSEANSKYSDSLLKFNVISGFPRYILETLIFVSMLSVMLVSIFLRKDPAELIPMMTAVGIAAIRFLPSINKIYTNIYNFRYASNSLDIVYKILQEDRIERETPDTISLGNLPEDIEPIRLENITFCYRTAPAPIFKDFSLPVPAQKTIAFVGETGAGKSTLIDILMGLLIPSKGALYYGDLAITRKNLCEYRAKIGYVPQQIFLIDDSIEANIAFGVAPDKVDYQQLKRVIQICQLDSLIRDLPEGLKSRVGERGVKLSGGQRQRLGIARALYRSPEILILDEATSALDGYTEAELNKAIRNFMRDLTVIIVAHRLSTVERADIIYVMDHGKIIDQGSFKELTENSAVFQKLANQKFHSEVIEEGLGKR